MTINHNFLHANWNAPYNVKTLITTRLSPDDLLDLDTKISEPYGNFNLAYHVNDNPDHVEQNRIILAKHLPHNPSANSSNPYWLNQTHSNNIINLDTITNAKPEYINEQQSITYDASCTSKPNTVCAVMTADCLPILLTNTSGTIVAAIHAGWRGLANGIIAHILNQINLSKGDNSDILIYIGPCICKKHFIVGDEVYKEFIQLNPQNNYCFQPISNSEKPTTINLNKYYCDLIGITQLQLLNLGVLKHNIFFSQECTYCNSELFYSYRRNQITGRFASCIWLMIE